MMIPQRALAVALLIPFTLLTINAVIDFGYVGVVDYQLQTSAGWQVLADLTVALLLVLTWMAPELERAGRRLWPWVLVTLLTGSFGPLLYLAVGRPRAEERV